METTTTVLPVCPKPAPRLVSLNELERICQQNPTTYLVEGFLPADEVHVAVGDSGLGKTPWAYQLGLCVATGRPFLGYKTHQGKVVYLDLENGPQDVLQVAESLCGYLGVSRFPEEFLVPNDEIGSEMDEIVAQYKPSLVIVDTLRPYKPMAETKNAEMASLLSKLRLVARSEHCAILLLHHIRKPGQDGPPNLEETPALEWLQQASGARALINQTNTRVAFDYQRKASHSETALVMKFCIKTRGEVGPIYLERVYREGEPIGYKRMVGAKLLGNSDQEAVYSRLPQRFSFGEAQSAYGKTADPTSKFLKKCINVGILEQPVYRGPYEKIVLAQAKESSAQKGEGVSSKSE